MDQVLRLERVVQVELVVPHVLPRRAVAVDSGGVAWVNDSKATNVESTAAGLRGLSLPLPGQQPRPSPQHQAAVGAPAEGEEDRTGPRVIGGEGASGTVTTATSAKEGGRAVVLLGGVAKVSAHVLFSGNLLCGFPMHCALCSTEKMHSLGCAGNGHSR